MRFKNNLPFVSSISHEYDERFNKIGDSLALRDSARYVANDGADITSQIQDTTETSKTLTLDTRKNVAFSFTSKELTLNIDKFAERYLHGAALALANKFESDGLTLAYQSATNIIGTPGTTPATAQVILDAGARLDNNGAPVDGKRTLIVNPAAQASLVNAFSTLFNAPTELSKQYRSGRMGTALGFDFSMGQNVRVHTVGGWGTSPQLTAQPAAGATTLAISWTGSATGVAKKGDKFTIALAYAVNPITGDTLNYLQEFTVTANTTAVGSAIASLPIYPAVKFSGAGQTVSAQPTSSAALVLKSGTAAALYPQNIAFHKHAFCYAMGELDVPQGTHFAARSTDKDSGLSLRMVSDYEVLTDTFVTRVDAIYGFCARRPEWAAVVVG